MICELRSNAHRSIDFVEFPPSLAQFVFRFLCWWITSCFLVVHAADEIPPQADSATDPRAGIEYFERYLRPLLAAHCYECHRTDMAHENGQLDLESIAGIQRGGSRGPILDSHSPESSLLLRVITYEDPDLQMPPEGKLPDREIENLRRWLEAGAPLPPQTPSTLSSSDQKRSGMDLDAGRKFWSFQGLQETTPPEVRYRHWVQQPIDQFILANLEREGLHPNPQADRRTLLRRMSMNIVGLPPTAAQIDRFLASEVETSFESLVEQMLASPQYGERWGRLWLDLARYSDWTPDWQSPTDRGWIYRDWVVGALNANLPYDRFFALQLAADLIPDSDPADLAALGFLGLSPTYWKELRLAPPVIEQIVADEWDERIDAVTRTFLGLTVACARCHDHKFDPISTRDYYALAGVFASVQLHQQPLLPPAEAAEAIETRDQLQARQKELAGIMDPNSEDARRLAAEIEQLRSKTPHAEQPFAHTVREASVYVVADGPDATKLEYREQEPRDLPVFHRGNPSNPGEIVPRGYLSLFAPAEVDSGRHESICFTRGSGRQELVQAMLTHSQGLLARVIVNRVWAQHFGAGLVRTPSDFGSQGDPPTHPELLDYLAAQFVAHQWDLKWLHREILFSATWQQSSDFQPQAYKVDPENKLLWRMHRRRLDFEQWRDAILFTSGQLDTTLGGPPRAIDDPAHQHRTLYTRIDREELHPILRMHDFPEASSHSPSRSPTITPLQQLYVLNSPWIQGQSKALAAQILQHASATDQRIAQSYRLLFGRQPWPQELALAEKFLHDPDPQPGHELPPQDIAVRWEHFLQSLLGLNEFCFLE